MVNTELDNNTIGSRLDYNILNIVVNTEHAIIFGMTKVDYNILNIVVNTELR